MGNTVWHSWKCKIKEWTFMGRGGKLVGQPEPIPAQAAFLQFGLIITLEIHSVAWRRLPRL